MALHPQTPAPPPHGDFKNSRPGCSPATLLYRQAAPSPPYTAVSAIGPSSYLASPAALNNLQKQAAICTYMHTGALSSYLPIYLQLPVYFELPPSICYDVETMLPVQKI